MKKLLMVCLLACSSSGVAADHIPSPPPDVTKLCPDIEQATTTDAFKGFDRETFEEFICEVMKQTSVGHAPCRRALKALMKLHATNYPSLYGIAPNLSKTWGGYHRNVHATGIGRAFPVAMRKPRRLSKPPSFAEIVATILVAFVIGTGMSYAIGTTGLVLARSGGGIRKQRSRYPTLHQQRAAKLIGRVFQIQLLAGALRLQQQLGGM